VSDWEVPPPKGKLYAKYTLRVKDQRIPGKHAELTGELKSDSENIYKDKEFVSQCF
jgi:hypothetical protein